ncbi:hypothetical protein BCR39DRAFT_556142 [Naematelia encephala]|uniref:Uncharacterized protein n=1 Tax=Naematelia encephala TaxID=71784 RepID=A0A1Y2BJ75_9TREE|nr:hypothetical protein BCR39DRAFT_556142 [Naematelia encephala]
MSEAPSQAEWARRHTNAQNLPTAEEIRTFVPTESEWGYAQSYVGKDTSYASKWFAMRAIRDNVTLTRATIQALTKELDPNVKFPYESQFTNSPSTPNLPSFHTRGSDAGLPPGHDGRRPSDASFASSSSKRSSATARHLRSIFKKPSGGS